jgi:hypothetical protein
MQWRFDGQPTEIGWHAVLVCYDEQEGLLPFAAWWDGSAWRQKSVVAFGYRCDSEDEASRLAYEHDPDA